MVVAIVAIVIVLAVFVVYPWIDDNFLSKENNYSNYMQNDTKTSNTPTERPLPMKTSVRKAISSFCEIANEIDDAMPYAGTDNPTAKIFINGGNLTDGSGFIHCWYDKDYAGVDDVVKNTLHRTGLSNKEVSNGWYMTDSGWINYGCVHVSGYEDLIKDYMKVPDAIKEDLTRLVNGILKNHTVATCTVTIHGDTSMSFSMHTN